MTSDQHVDAHDTLGPLQPPLPPAPGRSYWLRVLVAVAVVGLLAGAVLLVSRSHQGEPDLDALLSGTQQQHYARVTFVGTFAGTTTTGVMQVDLEGDRSVSVTDRPVRDQTIRIGSDVWDTGLLAGPMRLPGKKWVHLPGGKGNGQQHDLRDMLGVLRRGGGRVTDEGSAQVAGRDLHRYRVTGVHGIKDTAFEVFLDGDGLLRRLVQKGSLPGGAVVTFQLDIEYTDTPVLVQAPPASEVVEFDDLGNAFTQQGTAGH